MLPVTEPKYDIEGLSGIASTILGIIGAQIIMLGVIALSIGSDRDRILACPTLVFRLLLIGLAIMIWNIAQKKISRRPSLD